jgi:hypothetical protein
MKDTTFSNDFFVEEISLEIISEILFLTVGPAPPV